MDAILKWAYALILKLFGPPDVDDEAALRAWIRRMIAIIASAAELTPTEWDDEIVEIGSQFVEDDEKWAVLYGIIKQFLGDEVIDGAKLQALRPQVEGFFQNIPWEKIFQFLMWLLPLVLKKD